ncbi:MAG: hypothetical protein IT209_08380 [Armatimonadetes bacterium]|nr:hypothetical protein [Armatimonadota bacterium]
MKSRTIVRSSLIAWVALAGCALIGEARAAEIAAGPEFPVGQVSVAAPFTQEAPAVAAGGTGYLVVWQDSRNRLNSSNDPDTGYDIYGIFLDSSGVPAMGEAFLISSTSSGGHAARDQMNPAVAWNGSNFLVVWSDRRAVDSKPHIYGARVSTSGSILDPDGFPISITAPINPNNPVPEQYLPAVASNGTDWHVVWQENQGTGFDIVGARVTAAGAVTNRSAIAFTADNQQNPDIAWNGTNYVVVWEDQRNSESSDTDIYGCRINSSTQKQGGDTLISNRAGAPAAGALGPQLSPSVACDSTGTAIIVWQDGRGSDLDIYGTRYTTAGSVVDTGGKSIFPGSGDQEIPDITWDGTQFMVVWRDRQVGTRYIKGCRLNSSAQTLDLQPFPVVTNASTGNRGPRIAPGLVAWYTIDPTNSDVFVTKMNVFGGIVSTNLVSSAIQSQPSYAACWNGNGYGVVWADRRNGYYQIYGARVDSNGIVQDAQGILLAAGAEQLEPAIAWSGSGYLVAWKEFIGYSYDIRGVRLDANMQPVGSPILIASADLDQSQPSIAWNGTKYLVVWRDQRTGLAPNYFTDIMGTFVTSAGALMPLSGVVSGALGDQLEPSVASDGTDFMVVWQDQRSGQGDIYATKVLNNGSIGQAAGVQLSSAPSLKAQPKIAYNGSEYLVVWSDARNNYVFDIYGTRLSTAAAVVGSDLAIVTAPNEQSAPSLCWAGSNYIVAWQDNRAAVSNYDIYLTRLNAAGIVIDANPTVMASSNYSEYAPVIAGGASAQAVFYSRFKNASKRLVGRTLNDPNAIVVPTIEAAKALSDGTSVSISGKVAIAGTDQLGGIFYIEEPNRVAGIKVVTNANVQEGNVVDIMGTIETVGSERQITASNVTVVNPAGVIPAPLTMRSFSIGGTGLLINTNIGSAFLGSNNVGLLIRMAGKVTYVGTGAEPFFYLDDGKALDDGSGHQGVKVQCGSLTKPALGDALIVTGVSSSESSGTTLRRRILARKQSDIAAP